MGITWWQFWELNPHKIKIITMGYREQKIEQDAMVYSWWGNYGLSAVAVAVEHCLAGKKAKSKYIEKPMLANVEKNDKVLDEEEKQKKAEQFFLQLEILGANFKNNHKDSSVS